MNGSTYLILGLVIGLALGLGLGFLYSTTRVNSEK